MLLSKGINQVFCKCGANQYTNVFRTPALMCFKNQTKNSSVLITNKDARHQNLTKTQLLIAQWVKMAKSVKLFFCFYMSGAK